MRNLIEKMAVWYELKYPDYEINRMMPGSAIEENEITDEMKNVYSKENFIKQLPWEEECNFEIPMPYHEHIYASKNDKHLYTIRDAVLELDKKTGFIKKSKGLNEYSHGLITDDKAVGMSLKELYTFVLANNIDKDNIDDKECLLRRIKYEIDSTNKDRLYQEKLLDAIMYRIIERGGCRFGSRRGFLFAKEFNRNIDIPMKYIDTSDPGLGIFIDEYLKYGGDIDLICYDNYGSRSSDNDKIKTISLKDLIKIEVNRKIDNEVTEDLRKRLDNKELVKKL